MSQQHVQGGLVVGSGLTGPDEELEELLERLDEELDDEELDEEEEEEGMVGSFLE